MCQVTLIIVIHYVQMRVNILFLFKKKKKKSQAHHQWLQSVAEHVTSENLFKGQRSLSERQNT